MAEGPTLVTVLDARLDKFEAALKEAGVIAEREMGKIQQSVGAGAFGGTLLGGLVAGGVKEGVRELSKIITDVMDRVRSLDRVAQRAGISMNDLFGTQSALHHANFREVNSSIEHLMELLTRAQAGETNTLTRALALDGKTIAGIKNANDLMERLADVFQKLSPLNASIVARALGIPDDVLRGLEKGSDAFRKARDEAAAAAPDLQRFNDLYKQFWDFARQVTEKGQSFIGQQFELFRQDLAQFLEDIASFVKALQSLEQQFQQSGFGKAVGAILGTPSSDTLGKVAAALEGTATGLRDTTRTPSSARTGQIGIGGFFDKAGGGRTDEFERANDALEKRTRLLDSDTRATFLDAESKARLHAQEELIIAAEKAGLPLSDERLRIIFAQADAYGKATAASVKMKEQLQAINEASREFGSALADAFKGAVLEGKKLNEIMSQLLSRLASKSIDKIFDLFFAPQGGQATSLFGNLLKPIFGTRALGGPVTAGSSYLIGEKGPEIFVPQTGGMIVPNNVASSMGMGGSNLTFAPTIVSNGASQADMVAAMAVAQQRFRSEIVPTVKQAMLRRAL